MKPRYCYDGMICEERDLLCSECEWARRLEGDSATKAITPDAPDQ